MTIATADPRNGGNGNDEVRIYLGVSAICWTYAMPSYLTARDGLTPAGDPIGWFPYSLACAVLSTAIVTAAYLGGVPAHSTAQRMMRREAASA
jgi:hypothetical protein